MVVLLFTILLCSQVFILSLWSQSINLLMFLMQILSLHDKVSHSNKRICKLFIIPRFHKKPYQRRFIAGASNATTKTLVICMCISPRIMSDQKCAGY